MTLSTRPLVLAASLALAAAAPLPYVHAQSAATVSAPLVTGLPDFTRLVEQVGPAVVNVEAKHKAKQVRMQQRQGLPDDPDMPEIFRRFFGPGMPFPGAPDVMRPGGTSLGSGFIISADGDVLTNQHVVDGADEVRVKLSDGRVFDARVVGTDKQSDVALLKINATGLPSLRLGASSAVRAGQWVVAMGSPFGLDHSVTAGIVSAVGRSNPASGQGYVPFIQTDVAINRGNSGGPLMDTRGDVVGINSQIFSNSGGFEGISFAIPIDTAMSAVKQLKATGRVSRGKLGVMMQAVTADSARAVGLPDTNGALVSDVESGSGAAKAGVQPMDVIRSLNGTRITDPGDLAPIVGAQAPGARVQLGVWRNGREITLPVVLGSLSAATTDLGDDAPMTPDSRSPAPSPRNALGLRLQDLDADDRRQLGLKPGEGVGIAAIQGSAARDAGLRPGDIVLGVGRTRVGTADALDQALGKAGKGDTVMLLVQRQGGQVYVPVTVGG